MIYIVTALHPRSGTTAMMKALEAGGLESVKSSIRNKQVAEYDDEDYKASKDGVLEISFAGYTQIDFPSMRYDGKLIKVFFWGLHKMVVHEYHIVFVIRDVEETFQSCKFGIKQEPDMYILTNYDDILAKNVRPLKNRRDVKSLNIIDYRDLIKNPLKELMKMNELGIEPQKAVAGIDSNCYRFRIENLTNHFV